jgi:hypothetical protein
MLEGNLDVASLSSLRPKFRMFDKVVTHYYIENSKNRLTTHGIVIAIEFCPPLTDKIGWWYKLLTYFESEADEVYDKNTYNIGELDELEVFEEELERDKIKGIDINRILQDIIEDRIKCSVRYKTGDRYY